MAIKRGKDIKELNDPVVSERSANLAAQLYHQFNDFHALGMRTDVETEIHFYTDIIENLKHPNPRAYIPKGAYIFMPSSASKCKRELYLHLIGSKKQADGDRYPYHTRWTRNSTAVHEATQRDFLYMAKFMPNAPFVIHSVDHKPMWEENIKTGRLVEHKGKMFALVGQMDGILLYRPDNKLVGFEFKTKTNSVAQVGTYKLKEVPEMHQQQSICYSMMFDLDEFLFMYEAVSKDQWNKGADAKMDIRVFHIDVTEEMRNSMKDKFVEVIEAIETKVAPPKELDKCMFCEYKSICEGMGN